MNIVNSFCVVRNLNKQATAIASPIVLRSVALLMRFFGVLQGHAKGAISSLFAVASTEFKQENSGSYIVPYAKIGTPSAAATDSELAEKLWSWTYDELRRKGKLDGM
jgi:hypothetical protein